MHLSQTGEKQFYDKDGIACLETAMQSIDASKLTLEEVHRLLRLEPQLNVFDSAILPLSPLTESEKRDLLQIRHDFLRYLSQGKVSEGLVKFLSLAPLLRLAGFYDAAIRLTLETSLEINVEDEETVILGRLDVLALRRFP